MRSLSDYYLARDVRLRKNSEGWGAQVRQMPAYIRYLDEARAVRQRVWRHREYIADPYYSKLASAWRTDNDVLDRIVDS